MRWSDYMFLGLCLVCLSSCADRKLAKTAPGKAKASTLMTALNNHEPQFEWYSGKGRIRVATDDVRMGGTVHLRMIRDSVIWAKVDKFGFEVGRALITPDSAYVIDRLHKEYYVEHLDSFLTRYHAPFSFGDLQRVLAGGTINGHARKVQVLEGESGYGLQMLTDAFDAQYWFNRLFLLEKGTFTDPAARKVQLNYGDYRDISRAHPMPFERFLMLDDGINAAEIELSFAQIEVDVPKSVPFNIPEHYVKVD